MDNFDLILSDKEYCRLQKEYQKALTPSPLLCLIPLSNIISSININGFQMPLSLQNKILNNLLNAKKLLNIIHNNNPKPTLRLDNNPFTLIYHLSSLFNELISYSLKNTYQIIYLKASSFIIEAIRDISHYFSIKKLKN